MFNFSWFAGLVDGLKTHQLPLWSQKNEMLLFWITLNFWWLARLSDGLKPHPPSLSSQKMKCSFLYYFELLMISQAGQWTQTPSASPLQPIKWNAHFWIMFNFWWSAGLVDELKPHPSPLSTQKHEMLIFGSCSTSDDWPGWSMECNPICHPSPAKNMKCSFLDYAQLLMISQACQWTQTPSTTCLQAKKLNAHILIMFNFWCWPDWSMDSNPIHHPSAANKMKCFFLDYVHFWWSARLVDWLKPHLPPLSRQKNEMLIFWLCSTSDDWPDWSLDSNPIHHSSPAKKNEMLIFGLHSLLMICLADWWTWTPSATPLLPIKWNAQFLITFNFWWSAKLVNWLKVHLPALSSQ